MTFSQIVIWILIDIIILVFGGAFAYSLFDDCLTPIPGIIATIIVIMLMIAPWPIQIWYNHNTASGMRKLKDFQSEIDNGINREIRITAEDGREIFFYEGKVDIESNHTDNYIKFESEEGKRYIIYYGIQDTITIIEK